MSHNLATEETHPEMSAAQRGRYNSADQRLLRLEEAVFGEPEPETEDTYASTDPDELVIEEEENNDEA